MNAWRGGSAEDRRIRGLRPERPKVDLTRPHNVLFEDERLPDGSLASTMAVFLAGHECPFTCVFCDLWRYATPEPTPPGAIPQQLANAFERTIPERSPPTQVKLYNAANFFDEHAVPSADDDEIIRLLNERGFKHVVVECHPRLLHPRALRYERQLDGRLQVAMGLETIHPEALSKLNKKLTLEQFERAAAQARDFELGLRVFILVGAPYVPPPEVVTWAVRSTSYAFDQGAEHVTLIPARSSPGEMERLEKEGLFRPPSLGQLEEAYDRCLELLHPGTVNVDLWDLEAFSKCPACLDMRRERLQRINRTGEREVAVSCSNCG